MKRGTAEKEYILFCDESEKDGKFFSNFYGGVIVGARQYNRITGLLNSKKKALHLFGEVKWSKVTESYWNKYAELMRCFFDEIRSGHLRVRIMFRQNANVPTGLSAEQLEGTYFLLYYQFIKHAFGLRHIDGHGQPIRLRIYFDEFPETREAVTQFKGFILGLKDDRLIRLARVSLSPENIAEIRSHDHVLAQCLDVVLGAIAFRLNDKHREKPPGGRVRGKRTIAKEKLYKAILGEIHSVRPRLNIGISTGVDGGPSGRWSAPYLHWKFVPSEMEFRGEMTKGAKKSPTQPT